MKKKKIVWSNQAKQSLKEHYNHIKKESVPAAKKVREKIIEDSKSLVLNPEKSQADEYYPNNSGNIRRYFKWSYRIIYEVNEKTIDILNIIHTSQEPIQE